MKPKISLLTSFSASGLRALRKLEEQLPIDYVDLYTFMRDDILQLWEGSSLSETAGHNAVYAMATTFGDAGEVERIGHLINKAVGSAKIAAFATYAPEITSRSADPQVRDIAGKAIKFLIDLADFLHGLGHPISTIEIVGGSTVDGLWRGKVAGVNTYVVNRMDRTASLLRLHDRLLPIARHAANRRNPIRLAMELEPGPLFNISNKDAILGFSDMLDSFPEECRNVTGFNLDIPHWCFLAGIDCDWLSQHPQVLGRIAHAHISDHSSGHFCDADPLLFHGSADFAPWLNLLSKLDRIQCEGKSKEPPHYSGFLALELECCPDLACVKRSIARLRDLLDRRC